ncbi:cation:proton antiporter [Actinocorallia sp. A-T 12471]|uniref:cation:proton antiporter n=1 Tax=Actinocorallia sp. A-T 12471 TaxID=3089813 RepID=UPI0029CCDBEA|nr:cation:proton antiporter [Actinocorallia sp. A-T 12471]MDX6741529.1 cation:proton antiporter [Actinocorallia sp. A-T 12471]
MTPVPLLGPDQLMTFLTQVGVLLAVALLLGALARRLGLPAVVGELCAGVLLGPSVADQLLPGLTAWLLPKDPGQFHLLDALGQIGVLLLVGLTGIHLDLRLVRRRGRSAAVISAFGLVIPLGLGVGCGLLLADGLVPPDADRHVFALFLGVAMCVSAIPVIAKTLMDMGLLHRDIGQLTLTVGMVDDAVGWLLLAIVSAMATTGVRADHVLTSIGGLLLVLAMAALLRRPLGLLSARTARTPGATASAIAALVLLAAAGAQRLGLEPVFGAFVAGIVLGGTRAATSDDLPVLRALVMSVLAPVFFAIVGLRMDLTALGDGPVLLAALAVLAVAIAGKFLGAFAGALLCGLTRWEALALGAGMNARGVIEVIVATVGLRLGILTPTAYTIIILIAITTSLMAPPILRLAMTHIPPTKTEHTRLTQTTPTLTHPAK